jgi:hypothetical protein
MPRAGEVQFDLLLATFVQRTCRPMRILPPVDTDGDQPSEWAAVFAGSQAGRSMLRVPRPDASGGRCVRARRGVRREIQPTLLLNQCP